MSKDSDTDTSKDTDTDASEDTDTDASEDTDTDASKDTDTDASEDTDTDANTEPTLATLLSSEGRVRLLDVFLGRGTLPVSRRDLADLAGVHRSTASRRVDAFCEHGLVEVMPESSNPELFRVNTDHPVTEPLREAHARLFNHVDRLQEASDDYDADSDLYVAGSPFVELFRYPANVELLLALLENPNGRLTAADLARTADLDRSAVGDNVDVLVDIGVAERVEERYTSSPRYALADDAPVVEQFREVLGALGDNDQVETPSEGADTKETPGGVAPAVAANSGSAAPEPVADAQEGMRVGPEASEGDKETHTGDSAGVVQNGVVTDTVDGAELSYDLVTEIVTCEVDVPQLASGATPSAVIEDLTTCLSEIRTERRVDGEDSVSPHPDQ